jgi:hypothetical protein
MMSFDAAGAGVLRIVPAHPSVGEWLPEAGMPMTSHAQSQTAGRLTPNCPPGYLKELIQARPAVAAELLNGTRPNGRWFIRCLDGHARAVLSDRYRTIDHIDLAMHALAVVKEAEGQCLTASLDESKMRLSFTTRAVWDTLADAERNHGKGSHHFERLTNTEKGDDQPGLAHPLVTVTNSETGEGGCSVRWGILVARCINSSIIETAIDQVHLGGKLDFGISARDTQRAEGMALKLRLRDAIRAGLHPNTFARMIAKANKASEVPVEAPQTAASNVLKLAGLLSDERVADLLAHFHSGYAPTAYGLAAATSRLAQDMTTAADAAALEEAAGAVINARVALV